MTIYVTVTVFKGGVVKTTTIRLMARYFSEHQLGQVLLIDLDHKGGFTSLLLGTVSRKLTIKGALVAAMEGDDSCGKMRNAIVNKPNLPVIPSNKRLMDMISGILTDLLRGVLQFAVFSDETTVIIDTGTAQGMVGMGICSDETHWENKILDFWQTTLNESPELKPLNVVILPRVPLSKALIRGAWAKMPFPSHLDHVFDAIYTRVFGKSALPALPIAETLEVVNG